MYAYIEKKEPAEKLEEIQEKRTTDGVKSPSAEEDGSRVQRRKDPHTWCSIPAPFARQSCLHMCTHACTQTYTHANVKYLWLSECTFYTNKLWLTLANPSKWSLDPISTQLFKDLAVVPSFSRIIHFSLYLIIPSTSKYTEYFLIPIFWRTCLEVLFPLFSDTGFSWTWNSIVDNPYLHFNTSSCYEFITKWSPCGQIQCAILSLHLPSLISIVYHSWLLPLSPPGLWDTLS